MEICLTFKISHEKSKYKSKIDHKKASYEEKDENDITVEKGYKSTIMAISFGDNPEAAIGKDGTAYLDDFEGSQSTIDVRTISQWKLASTPQGQPTLFPEGIFPLDTSLEYGFNRARLAWYNIDPLFWRNDSRTPSHIENNPASQSNHYSREVLQTEVFPFKSVANGTTQNISTLDLAFYPSERGQYNFDDGSGVGSGTTNNGKTLNNPSSRWGGIMRQIETTDFETSNVEFLVFWMMDPFDAVDGDANHSGGKLYFNLGDISEDILKDDRKSVENAMPLAAINYASGLNANLVDTTIWGRVPTIPALVTAFDNKLVFTYFISPV
jgi:cell surface protein SprA